MSSAVLIAVTGMDAADWAARFRTLASTRDVRVWPDGIGDTRDIAYAAVWKPPSSLLATLPNLRAIFSLGAGVDFLLGDPALPNVPIVRIVDSDLTARMTEYVLLHTLMIHRRQRLYNRQQRDRVWREHDQPAAKAVNVGVMGLGAMGRAAADALHRVGFNVAGWSRTPKQVPGVACFHGASELDAFLAHGEILVVLLPHTGETDGILSRNLFRKLNRTGALRGAHLINAGRGKLQIEADILAALDDGTLASATLDVFAEEPLPQWSALWTHANVTITPHNAAMSDPQALAENIIRQIARFEAGQPLGGIVDRAAGY